MSLRELLERPNVEEVLELRGAFGLMAPHGGALEERTDLIARTVAERTGASYYGVHQPADLRWHVPSHRYTGDQSPRLERFLGHVSVLVTLHGYGRMGYFTTILLGGSNRDLARHLADPLRRALPAYVVEDDAERIPHDLAGRHPNNPVNVPRNGGVQIELPPRVRGSSPLWWDWEAPHPTPHTAALIDALVDAVSTWTHRGTSAAPHGASRSISQPEAVRR